MNVFVYLFYTIVGRVYNVTPYLEFHPGGIPELMRGIGRDATDLFDEVSYRDAVDIVYGAT